MPAMRYWEVIQTRKVRVSAPTPASATLISEKAFSDSNIADSVGSIQSEVRIIEVIVREDI
jgi:hypothetical protein